MRNGTSLRGFTIGVLVGVLVGSAGMASATFGLAGWSRFSDEFRTGYINGFLDMANLARNLEPGGWVDERYPYFPKVRPLEWRGIIDKLYKDPANKDYLITSMIQLAAKTLEERYGKPTDPAIRAKERMEAQMQGIRTKLARQAAKQAAAAAPAPGAGTPAAAAPVDAAKAPAEVAKAPVAVGEAATRVDLPRQKKWCRCDGTDPQAARAKRRAAAAAEEAGEDAEAAKPAATAKPAAAPNAKAPAAAPAKTPPNGAKPK